MITFRVYAWTMDVDVVDIRNSDVSTWFQGSPFLSIGDVCAKHGVDTMSDPVMKILTRTQWNEKVIVTNDVLKSLGYAETSYSESKKTFHRLLQRNPQFGYTEVVDNVNPRKKYFELNLIDFECLLMQMRTEKAQNFKKMYIVFRICAAKFAEYQRLSHERGSEMWEKERNELVTSANKMNDLVLGLKRSIEEESRLAQQERLQAAEREKKAEEERRKAEEERLLAVERERKACLERQLALEREEKAERERKSAEKERRRAILREKRAEQGRRFAVAQGKRLERRFSTNNLYLRNGLAQKVVPPPISMQKVHRLGLYKTANPNEWYLMRRQIDGWAEAEKRLLDDSKIKIKIWNNVSHAIDIGNILKRRFRSSSWYAYHNTFRVPAERQDIRSEDIVEMIENILFEENEAHQLANENEQFLQNRRL